MRVVIFVVSVEAYPASPGLALPGSHDDARRFIAAVRSFHPHAELTWCASPRVPESTHDATRAAIIGALRERMSGPTGWRGAGVDRVYAFVSGHGAVARAPGDAPVEVLVTAERHAADDGALLPLAELQYRLAETLGPGVHHWFVDACRTDLTETPAPLPGTDFPPHSSRSASYSRLWSTLPRAPAAARSGFGEAVAEGLAGDARGWTAERIPEARRLVVDNQALAEFVEARIHTRFPEQDVYDDGGRQAAELRVFEPPPTQPLVLAGPGRGSVDVILRPGRGTAPVHVALRGETEVVLVADDYAVEPVDDTWMVDQPRVDLLPLNARPRVRVAPRPRDTPLTVLPEVRSLRVPEFGIRQLRTPLGQKWLRNTGLDRTPDPHLSETLHGIPVDPSDVGDGVTLAAVAAVLGGGFHLLDRGGFTPPPRGTPGVFVVLSPGELRRGGATARLLSPDGATSFAVRGLGQPGPAVALHTFLPLPAGAPPTCRLVVETDDGYQRALLVPVAADCVTVVHNLDERHLADQRLAIVPVGAPRDVGMRLAGQQILAQAQARDGVVDPSTPPLPPVEPAPPRVAEVYGALVRRATRFGARSADEVPYAEVDPPWVGAVWSALVDRGDPRVAAWSPQAPQLYRSPLTTWRLRAAGG